MYNDPIFIEGLAGLGRGGFHLLRGRIFFSLILTGEIFNKNSKALTDPGNNKNAFSLNLLLIMYIYKKTKQYNTI
jgi:hypothetical protein